VVAYIKSKQGGGMQIDTTKNAVAVKDSSNAVAKKP